MELTELDPKMEEVNFLKHHSASDSRNATFCMPKRYVVVFLTFIGMVCMYILRTNLSLAIVDMTSNKTIVDGNRTWHEEAKFNWNSKEKGFVLSLFSYGYFLGPFGGLLSIKYGGATVFGAGIVLTAILTALSPLFLRIHFVVFAIARIFEGVFESCAFAAFTDIFVYWAPPDERTRLMLLAMTGTSVGGALNYVVSGFVAHWFGWECVFYVTGGVSVIWFLIFFLFVGNNPSLDKFISKEEREYFRKVMPKIHMEKVMTKHPYKSILTSGPVWSLINEHFSIGWFMSFIYYGIPLFIKDVHDVNIQNIGLISSIPLACGSLGLIISPFIADYLRSRKLFPIPIVHRIFIGIGQTSALVLLIFIGLWATFTESIVCLTLMRVLFTFAETSYHVLAIDMFSGYASLVKGICLTAFSLSILLNPIVMGFIVTNRTRFQWNTYFLFLSFFNMWSLTMFCFFGSGKLQTWAMPSPEQRIDYK